MKNWQKKKRDRYLIHPARRGSKCSVFDTVKRRDVKGDLERSVAVKLARQLNGKAARQLLGT